MSTTKTLPDASLSPLGKLYRKRVARNRDLTIHISSWDLERGTGKTTLALRLAAACDRTDDGVTPDKCTLSATEMSDAYTSQPIGSSLILDEASAGLSNRRAMSGINEAMRQIVSLGRVEQKYLFMTSVGVHQVDVDIRRMCDLWIFVTELGTAEMFRVKYDPFLEHELTKHWGTLQFNPGLPGPLQESYDAMTDEKRRHLRGEETEGDGYVKASEAQESAEQARKEAKRQKRDEMIRRIYQTADDMTQQKLADIAGLSRSRIADILSNSDD